MISCIPNKCELEKEVGSLKATTVLIKNSNYKDDKVIMFLIYKKLKEYKCEKKECSVEGIWLKQPITLLLKRKNLKDRDLRLENLELNCPNCYYQSFSTNIKYLKKIEQTKFPKCQGCGFNLTNLAEHYKNMKLCKFCYNNVNTKCDNQFTNLSILSNATMDDNEITNDELKAYCDSDTFQMPISTTTNSSYQSYENKKNKTTKNELSSNFTIDLDLNIDLNNLDFN